MKKIFENWRRYAAKNKIEEYKGVNTKQAEKILRIANKEAIKTVAKAGIARTVISTLLSTVGGVLGVLFWPSEAGRGSTLSPAQRRAQENIIRRTSEKTGAPSPEVEKIIKREAEKAGDVIDFPDLKPQPDIRPGPWGDEPVVQEPDINPEFQWLHDRIAQRSEPRTKNPQKYCEDEISESIWCIALIQAKIEILRRMKAIRDRHGCRPAWFKLFFNGGSSGRSADSLLKILNKGPVCAVVAVGMPIHDVDHFIAHLTKRLQEKSNKLNSLIEKCSMTSAKEVDVEETKRRYRKEAMCKLLRQIRHSKIFDFLDTSASFNMRGDLKNCLPLKQEIRKMWKESGCVESEEKIFNLPKKTNTTPFPRE